MLLVLLAPFIFSVAVGFFGRFFGYIGSCVLANVGLFINLIASLTSFFLAIIHQSYLYLPITDWVVLLESNISWNLCFDFNTLVMFIVVNGVSCVVHLFSASYMAADPHVVSFMSYISFFTGFMLILVTGDNLFQLFLGWEGVGLCSYLLISFWYTRVDAVSSGLNALIVNRISDFMLLCALLLISLVFYSLDFSILLALADLFIFNSVYFTSSIIINLLFICCCLLLFGAMGNSAQILLHTWLPDAMEGPTPVSALIHAATMVTAGVFLILRCSVLFELAHTVLLFLLMVGGFTAFISGTIGVVQFDMKNVIAYSTCSQLGYMVLACGSLDFLISFFHLVNHAFF